MAARIPAAPPLPAAAIAAFDAPADWKAIDLLSDLHLAESTPEVFDAWAEHLAHTDADAVFILGDLFEVWIGDDLAERGFEAKCAEILAAAAARRTVAFMAGNRDFLVGDALLASSGVLRFEDPTVVVAFGERVLLSHGDALCVDDVAYQRFRSLVRRPIVQRAFGALPLTARRAIGRTLRRQSARRPPGERGRFVDVDSDTARVWLREADAATLVHGHTHAPASHDLGAGVVRHVLSDWELDGSSAPRAEVLRWDARGFRRIAPQRALAERRTS